MTDAVKVRTQEGSSLWVNTDSPGWVVADEIENLILNLSQGKYYISDINMHILNKFGTIDEHTITKKWHRLFDSGIFMNTNAYTYRPNVVSNSTTVLFLEITYRCPLRCKHCYYRESLNQIDLPFEDIRKIIYGFRQINGRKIKISGGEPTLHPNFIEIIQLCQQLDMQVTVLSNMTQEANWIDIVKYDNMVTIQTSLDSYKKCLHDEIRGRGSFTRTVGNIRYIRERRPDIQIRLACMIWKSNISTMHNYFDFGASLGVNTFHLSYFKPVPYTTHVSKASNKKIFEFEKWLFNEHILKSKYTVSGSISQWVKNSLIHPCERTVCTLINQIKVDPNGNVFPCPQLSDEKSIIMKSSSLNFETILDDISNHQFVHDYLDRAKKFPYSCRECLWRFFCKGGCLALTKKNDNYFMLEDAMCGIKKNLYSIIPFHLY